MAEQETVRLNKFLAQCGVCSRREADKLIEKGNVLVNGRIAESGMQVSAKDVVSVNGKVLSGNNVKGPEKTVVLAYYKPIGVVCTEKDEHAKKKVTEEIHYPIRVTYAGRLDKDSEGLLLLTNDGNLIDYMMRGAHHHEKEYIVKTDKKVTDDFLTRMRQGVYIKDLDTTTRPCEVERIGEYTFRIVLTQGLNRQIRRMCSTLHYEVRSLKRVRVMSVMLGDLKPGQYRELSDMEIKELWEEKV